MQIAFMGAAGTVTGSKYLLTFNGKRILLDCGMYQGYKELRLRNWALLPVDPKSIDAVILTHAHIDHTGYIPRLIKFGFKGNIHSTFGTKALCAILLPDSGHIAEEDAKRANKYGYTKHHPALPFYTKEEGLTAINQFVPHDFNQPYDLFEHFTFEFLPAGHIIGSAIVRIKFNNKTIVFTGNLGRPHDPVMNPPALITAANSDFS